jgi:hypothetical protein
MVMLDAAQETIVRAAIRHVEGDVHSVPRPGRHHDVIHSMGERYQHRRPEGHEQGFLTSTGRFIGRDEAWRIAERSGQLLPRATGAGHLFSEDVW